jgi:SAM-dependent methyltransferase
VLGAGECRELPLAELVALFDHVTLNDIHREPLERAAAQLDPAAREKLSIDVADLTGLIEPLLANMQQRLNRATDPQSAFDAMAECLDACPPGSLPIAGPFDLVIASCVLSQLHYALTHRSDVLLDEKFPGQVMHLQDSPRWTASLRQLKRRMKATFLDGLVRLTAPGGILYLSDSVQLSHVRLTPEGPWLTAEMFRMVRSAQLADLLDERFAVIERGRWEWVGAAPSAKRQVGRVYDVQGLVLRVSI